MDIAKSETFKNFIILNKVLLFLIKLSKLPFNQSISIIVIKSLFILWNNLPSDLILNPFTEFTYKHIKMEYKIYIKIELYHLLLRGDKAFVCGSSNLILSD